MLFYLSPNTLKQKIGTKVYDYVDGSFASKWEKKSTLGKDLYNPKSLNDSLIDHFEYKLEHLLKWDDLNSMHFSIESRVPFLDHHIVESTLPLKSRFKINNAETKFILRESVKEILPSKVYKRKDKKGFSTPSDDWFRTPKFQNYICDLLASDKFKKRGYFNVQKCQENYDKHLRGKINISKDIWKWINLEVWFRNFID